MIRLEIKTFSMMLTRTSKVSALSSGKIVKYEYLTSKEISPPDQSRVTPQAKFSYSPLEKIKNQLKIKVKYKCKQLKSIKSN